MNSLPLSPHPVDASDCGRFVRGPFDRTNSTILSSNFEEKSRDFKETIGTDTSSYV